MSHENSVVRNVTITLDDETARWARIEAAKKDISLSRLIRDLLEETYKHQAEYQRAMESYKSILPRPLKRQGERYPTREEIYER